eukprot:3938621-Rhodomonas_salina.1
MPGINDVKGDQVPAGVVEVCAASMPCPALNKAMHAKSGTDRCVTHAAICAISCPASDTAAVATRSSTLRAPRSEMGPTPSPALPATTLA